MVAEEERRKSYTLTPLGRQVLLAQISRLEVMSARGSEATGGLKSIGRK